MLKLRVPPLRERREDIPLLFAHFLRRAAATQQRAPALLTTTVRRRLLDHDWPGNVRELAHFAERVSVGLGDGPDATPDPPGTGLVDRVGRYEADLIREALEEHSGDIAAVTSALRIPRKTLYDKMQRYGLKPSGFRERRAAGH